MRNFIIGLLILFLLALTGCAGLDQWANENTGVIETGLNMTNGAGAALMPATGGLSGLIALILTNVVTTGLYINRAVVAHKRAKQANAIVKSIDAGKANGVVNFNDPATVKLIKAIQKEAGVTSVVDAAQGK